MSAPKSIRLPDVIRQKIKLVARSYGSAHYIETEDGLVVLELFKGWKPMSFRTKLKADARIREIADEYAQ
jgi:hypothetical protein